MCRVSNLAHYNSTQQQRQQRQHLLSSKCSAKICFLANFYVWKRPLNLKCIFNSDCFEHLSFPISSSYSQVSSPILTACKEHELLIFHGKRGILDHSQSPISYGMLILPSNNNVHFPVREVDVSEFFFKDHHGYLSVGKTMQCICRDFSECPDFLINLFENL